MERERWERIQALFHRALAYPEAERAGFLATSDEEPSLLADVRSMLGEDARPADLFSSGLAHLASAILHPTVVPQKFYPYKLVKLLGEGGMGVVYLAQHEDRGHQAAVKVLRDSWISTTRRERFKLEQRVLAGLSHPNIALLFEAHAPPDETPWFAMEYVEGLSITKHCRQFSLAIPARLELFRSLCAAVQYAHENQLIHRDLKPSNVLVSSQGVVKLLDFGIAKHLDTTRVEIEAGHSEDGYGPRWMTRSHAAPEQLLGEPTGVFTDVYALGVILYELLADRLPFDQSRKTPEVTEPAPPSSNANLSALCLTAMHRDPSRRYPSVKSLIEDLDDSLAPDLATESTGFMLD